MFNIFLRILFFLVFLHINPLFVDDDAGDEPVMLFTTLVIYGKLFEGALMADRADILWNFYQEHCAWERHHEGQRASVTNILLVVAAGVLSVITFDGISRSDLPLTIFLILQGLFGALFVAKQYESFAKHQRRANTYRKALDERFPEYRIILLRDLADKEQAKEYPILYGRVRLNKLWVCLHLLIALFGVVLTGLVLFASFKAV